MITNLNQAFTRLARTVQTAQTAVSDFAEQLQSTRTGARREPRTRRPDHPVRQAPITTTVAVLLGPERSRDWRAQMH
ncbi:hypothetical protein VSR01_10915 [Actinacidiphila sp. DG2A-62]|uniref:hypothetical protein n=1 Tax=Actinacidiphila sp. DG2A-62 TaxID=3108821 RepID=UPI002DBFB957|nr:hypothetical protein [Actinacidiphila sp. DG2A-62]MEC3994030.1 hypothetical protein [Actinacidiphila sp. DG2A-62]